MTQIFGDHTKGLYVEGGFLLIKELGSDRRERVTSFDLSEHQKIDLALALLRDVDADKTPLTTDLLKSAVDIAGVTSDIIHHARRKQRELTDAIREAGL